MEILIKKAKERQLDFSTFKRFKCDYRRRLHFRSIHIPFVFNV